MLVVHSTSAILHEGQKIRTENIHPRMRQLKYSLTNNYLIMMEQHALVHYMYRKWRFKLKVNEKNF